MVRIRSRQTLGPKHIISAILMAVLIVLCTVVGPALVSSVGWAALPLITLLFFCAFIFFKEFEGDFFEPIIVVVVYFVIFYVISAGIMIAIGAHHNPHFGDAKLLAAKALFYCLLALFFLYMGYKSNLGRNLAYSIPVPSKKWDTKKATFGVILLLIVGLVAYYLLIYLNGGFLNYISHLNNRARLVQGKGPIREAINLIGLALFCSYILYQKGKKTIFRIVLLSIFLLLYTAIGLTLGGRGHVVNIFIILMFIHNYLIRRIKFRSLFIMLLILPFFLNLTGKLRSYKITSFQQLLQVSTKTKRPFTDTIRHGFGDIDTLMALLERVPEKTGFYWGRTYLMAPLGLVPRALWHDKPFGAAPEIHYIIYGTRFYFTWDLDAPQSAAAINAIEELYLNFSFLGVVIGLFFHGIILRTLYSYLLANKNNKSIILICAVLFRYFVPITGESMMFIIGFTPIFVVVVVFCLFVGRRQIDHEPISDFALHRGVRYGAK